MLRKNTLFLLLLVSVAGLALIGCSLTEPTDTSTISSENDTTNIEKKPAIFFDLGFERTGDEITVSWDTQLPTTSEVIWGYASNALTNSVTGGEANSHSLSFTADGTEGCVYMKAIATANNISYTSKLLSSVKSVVISGETRTQDPFACTMTLSWTTNVKSSTKMYWGGTCASPANVDYGVGNTTSHSVSLPLDGFDVNERVYMTPESSTGCDTDVGSCAFLYRQYCLE
jgi:hypothetical protein